MSQEISAMKMAKLNAAFLKKMQDACWKICIPHKTESDLNTGEKLCLDRCAAKYYETNDLISKYYTQDKNSQVTQ
ncbi:unnamed protein product [Blepharisma stoltei]|uniref:Mitochondrial import inner membrane translocase subunit n=1 Tax=Blepharisma stoltei TaxID=1481888 RepID=A0AAU9J9B2_9CILI|nr:unnamed protein product [Blepharisma stoltei]